MVALTSILPWWRDTVLLVKPETVIRLLWKHRSKATTRRESRLAPDTIELIRRMAVHNRTWGAERIRGELVKLGIRVAKRTIQRHIEQQNCSRST
jgi:putative transposase